MGWNIPDLTPHHKENKRPSIILWGIFLLFLLVVGTGLTVFFYDEQGYPLFWLYAVLAPFFIWLLCFGYRFSSYVCSFMENEGIELAYQEITGNWQQWSQEQIPIFGHDFICAEQDGIAALTGELANIPLFPEKARPLFNADFSSKPYWFLDKVRQNLQQQCPDHLKYLTHIYLPNELIEDDELADAIFERWDLKPEPIGDYAIFMEQLYDDLDEIPLSLILTCQYSDKHYHKHSKFISAMLMGAKSYCSSKFNLHAKAWLGRLMLSSEESLSDDIAQLVTYNQISPQQISDLWISGLNKQSKVQLAIGHSKLKMGLNSEHPFHDIDSTFATPTPLTHYFLLTMASCYAENQQGLQLTVNQSQQQLYLQLITQEQFI